MGKGCLAIPQEVGGLPEMVVLQNIVGLTRSRCRRGSGGSDGNTLAFGQFGENRMV